jgi:hypothetical protein
MRDGGVGRRWRPQAGQSRVPLWKRGRITSCGVGSRGWCCAGRRVVLRFRGVALADGRSENSKTGEGQGDGRRRERGGPRAMATAAERVDGVAAGARGVYALAVSCVAGRLLALIGRPVGVVVVVVEQDECTPRIAQCIMAANRPRSGRFHG